MFRAVVLAALVTVMVPTAAVADGHDMGVSNFSDFWIILAFWVKSALLH